jgi:hypothetical protein
MKLTADTITDAQIRELFYADEIAAIELTVATLPGWSAADRLDARARAAELFNARAITPMLITAATITDEQLRALRDRYAGTGDGDKYHHAMIALGERRAAKGETREGSRARCAAILNARSAT